MAPHIISNNALSKAAFSFRRRIWPRPQGATNYHHSSRGVFMYGVSTIPLHDELPSHIRERQAARVMRLVNISGPPLAPGVRVRNRLVLRKMLLDPLHCQEKKQLPRNTPNCLFWPQNCISTNGNWYFQWGNLVHQMWHARSWKLLLYSLLLQS